MKEKIRNVRFRPDTLERIEQMVEIVDEYQQQGLRLTARQLYYQFVSRGLIPNKDAEYKKLTSTLTDARYAGLVDWDAIEDRGREPNTPSEWDSPSDLMESALRSYRLPRWKGQPNYVELWVEKQALAGVLEPLAREYHATLMVNKGYSSASAMKESADRIKRACILNQERLDEIETALTEAEDDEQLKDELGAELTGGKVLRRPIILYLGDHDPSGEDMVRDIGTRLKEFGVLWLKVEGRAHDRAGQAVQPAAEPGQDHRPAGEGLHREVRRLFVGGRRAAAERTDAADPGGVHEGRRGGEDERGQGAGSDRQGAAPKGGERRDEEARVIERPFHASAPP